MKTKGIWYGVFTFAIFILIGLAFFLTNVPQVQQAIARAYSMPAYRSDKDVVCLVTVYSGDLTALIEIARNAASFGVPLTIGVTAAQLYEAPLLAGEIQSLGHTFALYGLKKDKGESSTHWLQRSCEELSQFRAITKCSDVLYVPYLGQHTMDASGFCDQYSLYYLLYCKDSRAYKAESGQIFAQVLAQNAQKGDFVYIAIDGVTDFSAISSRFMYRQLNLETVTNVLID